MTPTALQLGEVGRRNLAVTALLELVADLLPFIQGRQAGALDGADVHESVLAAIIRLNEAEALGGIKEFYGAVDH